MNGYQVESVKRERVMVGKKRTDKENTVSQTIEMLRESGFGNVECIYQYMKFAVIVAFGVMKVYKFPFSDTPYKPMG